MHALNGDEKSNFSHGKRSNSRINYIALGRGIFLTLALRGESERGSERMREREGEELFPLLIFVSKMNNKESSRYKEI